MEWIADLVTMVVYIHKSQSHIRNWKFVAFFIISLGHHGIGQKKISSHSQNGFHNQLCAAQQEIDSDEASLNLLLWQI